MKGEIVKLVVFDMDDTFWSGTLSEGDVRLEESHCQLVRDLVDRGIMCSISSKNNLEPVQQKLTEAGLWNLFVFPRINWAPKGDQVKALVASCCLRPENVLFVDDNAHNREEVAFACPGIEVAGPEILTTLLSDSRFAGKSDPTHERLRQFKVLESKELARSHCASNREFLYRSDVRVELRADCKNHAERILDLVNRTNQLNFTKVRLTEGEFRALLDDASALNRYVTVRDAFGDYGIVGFVSVADGACTHFLFSCRTIGLGVEQWVLAELGFPSVKTVGEVAVALTQGDCPDWINKASTRESVPTRLSRNLPVSVLLRGGCDLRQMEPYLHFDRLDCEFNHLKYHRDHTAYAVDVLWPNVDFTALRRRVPFLWENSFETDLYSGRHDVIVFSLLIDYIQTVYRSKSDPRIRLAFGGWMRPLSKDYTAGYTAGEMDWFLKNFEPTGCITENELLADLETILESLAPWVRLVLINAAEVEHENPDEIGAVAVHRVLNGAVDAFVSRHPDRVGLLDMRRIVTSRGQLTNNVRHYQREVYHTMAGELTELIEALPVGRRSRLASLRWKLWRRGRMLGYKVAGILRLSRG